MDDWLDWLRGPLPALEHTPAPARPARAVSCLFLRGLVEGIRIGAVLGATVGALLAIGGVSGGPVACFALGGLAGAVVALPCSLILATWVACVAAGHRPLQQTRRLHRDIWLVLLAGVGFLDLLITVLAKDRPLVALASVLVLTTALLVLLRGSARRLVVCYAVRSGFAVSRRSSKHAVLTG